jgi:anti-anti-sigma factor
MSSFGGHGVGDPVRTMAAMTMHRGVHASISLELVVHGATASVAVVGELDVASSERLRAVVGAIIDVPGIRQVQIDGRGIDFVDSAGLRALLLSRADARVAGVMWSLDCPSPALRRLLELAGVPGLLSDPAVN